MPAREVIVAFLSRALESRWRDRFVGFVSRPKTQGKFLDALHHNLFGRFDSRVIVSSLPDSAWASPAYSFSTAGGFGVVESSMRDAHARCDDAILVVTRDGACGYYREEDLIDSEVLISVAARR